jgi:hypothetical protein
MRKHRIIGKRNRDTAVYVMLNSDWAEEEFKLKKFLGIPIVKKHKIAEIDSIDIKNLSNNSNISSNKNNNNSSNINITTTESNKKK